MILSVIDPNFLVYISKPLNIQKHVHDKSLKSKINTIEMNMVMNHYNVMIKQK